MIRPHPVLKVYIAEKATANLVVTAHRYPRSLPQGTTGAIISNDFFNSLLARHNI